MVYSSKFPQHGNTHIFLSYRSIEVEFALKLAADLKNAGVKLWMDRLDISPGDDWRSSLEYAVMDSEAVIAVLSPEYVGSRYCLRELARADRLEKTIFPIMLRPLDETQWPIEIERHQHVDFSNWHDPIEYRQQLMRLVDVLKERFTDQFVGEPSQEVQIITNLAAELETQRGLTEYLELATEADKWFSREFIRPEPMHNKNWTCPTNFIVFPESAHEFIPSAFPQRRIDNIDHVLEEIPSFVLTGATSTGKTSVLRHLVLQSIASYQADPENAPYPYLLDLVAWDDRLDFRSFIQQQWPLNNDPIQLLETGKAILFLDGLNEIQGEQADKIQQIRRWLDSHKPPRRMVITCRSENYGPDTWLGLPCVQIGKMNAEHIHQFAVNYLGEEIAPFLVNQIIASEPWKDQHKHYLYELARNPFYLSAMILAHKSSPYGDVPENLGGILQRLVIEMWQRESLKLKPQRINFEAFEAALSDLAYVMTEHEQGPYVPYQDALSCFGDKTLLETALSMNFLEMQSGHLRFAYQGLQAYFAARCLTEDSIREKLSAPEIARGGTYKTNRWDMPILIYASLTHSPDALILDIARINPFLALECIANGVNVSDRLVEPILGELIQVANISQQDARVATASILARISSELALPVLLEAMRVGHWHVRQAAALALWDVEIPKLEGLSSILQDLEDDIEDATNTAVRHLGTNALPTLLQLLYAESWKTRRSAAWALGHMKDRAAVPGLVHTLSDEDNLVSAEAARTLGLIKDAAAVPRLLESLRHSHWRVRKAAAQALGAIGSPAMRFLLAVLNDKEEEVRRLVTHALKAIDDPDVVSALLERSEDDSPDVRAAAIHSLQGRVDGIVMQRLIDCLSDTAVARWNRKRISDTAAQALLRMNSRQLSHAILEWHYYFGQADENQAMDLTPKPSASTAKQRLSEIKRDAGPMPDLEPRPDVEESIAAFYAGEWQTRLSAVRALSNEEPTPVTNLLLMRALDDPQAEVRVAAVVGLAKVKDDSDTALNILLRGLRDSDDSVIEAVQTQIKRLGKPALIALVKLLEHPEPLLRARSAMTLGKYKTKGAVAALIKRLDDSAQPETLEQRVCDYAALALQAIGTEDALSAYNNWQSPSPAKAPQVSQERGPKTNQTPRKELLSELLDKVEQADWGEREMAAQALREYAYTLHGVQDPHIMQQLCHALEQDSWVLRWAAAEAMAWIGDPAAVQALIPHAGDENWMVRVAVIRAMLEIGSTAATDTVLLALQDDNSVVREAAAEALGVLGGSKAIRGLSKALSDEEALVRLAATISLGNVDSKGRVRPLIRALSDEDEHVRWTAAAVFANKFDEQAVASLIQCLSDTGGPYWEDTRICHYAAEALKQSKTPAAKAALLEWSKMQAGQV